MTTLTLKINERSKKGKAFLAFAKTFFDDNSDVEIVESDLNSSIKKNIYSQSFIDKIKKADQEIKDGKTILLNVSDIWGNIL